MTEHNEEETPEVVLPDPIIEVVGGALHLTNVIVNFKPFNGTIPGREITRVEFINELNPGQGHDMRVYTNGGSIQFPIENLEAFNKLEAELLHPAVPEAPYDGYGLTGNSEGQFWIIGNRNGNESCFIDLSTADEVCLDTSDENQFLVKVFHSGRISRFNTTRVQWDNLHNTINGRLVRYDLNASKPNTPEE